jgi:hypothetical protein
MAGEDHAAVTHTTGTSDLEYALTASAVRPTIPA